MADELLGELARRLKIGNELSEIILGPLSDAEHSRLLNALERTLIEVIPEIEWDRRHINYSGHALASMVGEPLKLILQEDIEKAATETLRRTGHVDGMGCAFSPEGLKEFESRLYRNLRFRTVGDYMLNLYGERRDQISDEMIDSATAYLFREMRHTTDIQNYHRQVSALVKKVLDGLKEQNEGKLRSRWSDA
jgi:hypothetical protein